MKKIITGKVGMQLLKLKPLRNDHQVIDSSANAWWLEEHYLMKVQEVVHLGVPIEVMPEEKPCFPIKFYKCICLDPKYQESAK